MPEFLVRLYSKTLVRLCQKPYDEADARKTLYIDLPHAKIAVIEMFREIAEVDGLRIPNGFLLQVKVKADDIDLGIMNAVGVANHTLSMISCTAMCSIESLMPIWVYDATPGTQKRDYRCFCHEGMGPQPTRRLEDKNLIEILDKNFTSFLNRADIKDDFKERVQRAIVAFKRGISDNDDVLTEFLTHWSAMEGLDCVYRKVRKGDCTQDFKDGIRDVLTKLGKLDLFESLETLRNGIAHGSTSLTKASQLASENVDLIRKALVLMILRILDVSENTANQIIGQNPYKGKTTPHLRVRGFIEFDPVDVQDFENQPRIKVWVNSWTFKKLPETLGFTPDIRIMPENLIALHLDGYEFWGDTGAPIQVSDMQSVVLLQENIDSE